MSQDLRAIARFLVDAFDVDMQVYMGKAIRRLRDTPEGTRFASWAEANPLGFQTLLRLISASAQRLPNDNNVLIQAVSDQLGRLPVELHRTFADDASTIEARDGSITDGNFRTRYEEALADQSDEQLEFIAGLPHSRIVEWVNTPAKLRPHLLKRWKEERPALERGWYHPATQQVVTSLADKMRARIEALKEEKARRDHLK